MRDCPQCGMPVDGDVCLACGAGKKAVTGPIRDADWGRCANVEAGQRCSKPGSIAHTTLNRGHDGKGESGPWYCQQHAFPHERSRVERPMFQSAIDAARRALKPPRQPGEDDA